MARWASSSAFSRSSPLSLRSRSTPSFYFDFLVVILYLLLNSGVVDAITVRQALGYIPNQTAAITAAALYFAFSLAHFGLVFVYRHWWGLCLPIGALGSGIGFTVRYILAQPSHYTATSDQTALVTTEQVLVLCCPAAFLAFNYIIYGRLVQHCIGARHGIIRPSLVSVFFVASDITTFLIQAAGASLVLQPKHSITGKTIVKVGVALQTASFVIFCAMLPWTWLSIRREKLYTGREVWWKAYVGCAVSSVFILVRAIYRMIASLVDPKSSLVTHEIYLYLLDVLPLLLSIAIYVPFWPGRYVDGTDSIADPANLHLMRRTAIHLPSSPGAESECKMTPTISPMSSTTSESRSRVCV